MQDERAVSLQPRSQMPLLSFWSLVQAAMHPRCFFAKHSSNLASSASSASSRQLWRQLPSQMYWQFLQRHRACGEPRRPQMAKPTSLLLILAMELTGALSGGKRSAGKALP